MMKKLFTSLLVILTTLPLMAQGWPEKYEGVMLQGFYWDSYTDSNWANLESQADELSQFFNLIWIPNSGKTSAFYHNNSSKTMGYDPCFWLDHSTCFGTETQLRSMINTFKTKGTGIIEDVVINHKNGLNSWCDFPNESKNGYTLTWDNTNFSAICVNDECNSSENLSQWSTNGKKTTGAADTGDNFNGYRDLDHTNATVQQNVKTYLNFLLKDLGYAGFRYDMVKGFSSSYIKTYNDNAQPTYSVGEYWDGNVTLVRNWINGTGKTSAAFDFPLKYYINNAFRSGSTSWADLGKATLANDADYARYAVTFVDNHDTGRPTTENGIPLYANIEAANAFILTMPGTPCVWLKHWMTFKTALKKQILVRKAAGIHSQSSITTQSASTAGYILNVQGTKGSVLLLLGAANTSTSGYKLAVEGTSYKMYVSENVDISALDNIKDNEFTAPDCCVVNDGEICAFFEAPTNYTSVKGYAWRGSIEYAGAWPGQACTKVGTNNGKNVWKWTYTGAQTTPPSNIIFNGTGFAQTADLDFQNGGYYNEAGALQGAVTTAIEPILTTPAHNSRSVIYDLQGRRMGTSLQSLPKGLYIVNGKKVMR